MSSKPFTRRLAAVVGGGALIAMGALMTGCGNNGGEQAPSTTPTATTTTTTTPTSSPAAPAPTEKSINPTGGNLFSPQILAPPAPTEPPGVHRRN